MRQRVVHVLWTADIGGIERLVLDLARVQAASGEVEVGILFGRGAGDFEKEFEGLGVPLHTLGLRSGRDLRVSKYRQAVAQLGRYDSVHFHSFNPLLARAARAAGKRIVYTEHGNFGFGRRRRLSDRVNDWLKGRFLNRHVDFITFNSRFTRGVAEERFGLQHVARRVVYNGIDQSQSGVELAIDDEIARRLEGRFVIGVVCRLAGFKRVDRLLEGFARVRGRERCVLLVVGDGPERSALEERASRLGIAGETLFAGFRKGVRSYQQRMDVCVCPSVGEPFGLVAVEALGLGKPVVAFADGGGLVEIVGDLEPKDIVAGVADLARRLEYYFVSRSGKPTNARRRHAARFEIGVMAQAFESVYASIEEEGARS